jgi:regulator of sigma E protease
MLTLITIGVVVLVLSVLVFVHELGHFIAAKRTGVVVEEFAFGYPPRVWKFWQEPGEIVLDGKRMQVGPKTEVSRKIETGSRVIYETETTDEGEAVVTRIQPAPEDMPDGEVARRYDRQAGVVQKLRRGTEYAINLIPFGGYVRMLGEEDPSAAGSFASKSKRVRILVLAAGAAMTLVLAVLVFAAAFALGAPQVVATENVLITGVAAGSPAEEAGLRVGDIIVAVNGAPVASPDALVERIDGLRGDDAVLEVKRGTETLEVTIRPRVNPPEGEGAMGVAIQPAVSEIAIKHYPIGQALLLGAQETFSVIALTVSVPILLLRGLIPAELVRPIGPPGIVQQTASAVQASVQTGWWFPVLNLVGLISTALAITNLLPLPALDGGRIFFIVVEAVRGRRIDPAREGFIHLIGLAILMVLMLVISYYDIVNPMPKVDWVSLFGR